LASSSNGGGYGLTGLDYWRLSDELSVVDATFLTLNLDPGCFEFSMPATPASSKIIRVGDFEEWESRALFNGDIENVELEPNQFRAVFKAIRNAILGNKLRANVITKAREPNIVFEEDVPYDTGAGDDEQALAYGLIVGRGTATLFSNSVNITNNQTFSADDDVVYILKEPDWTDTKVSVEDVKKWYSSRGVYPAFFFPSGHPEGFRDSGNPRYSAKLATAIAAWEAVKRPSKNKSVKQSLADWIASNGVKLGLGNDEGVVTPTIAEEVAKIANWQTSGGATKTAYDEDNEKEGKSPIVNFTKIEDDLPF
jgi:hypothetical protein